MCVLSLSKVGVLWLTPVDIELITGVRVSMEDKYFVLDGGVWIFWLLLIYSYEFTSAFSYGWPCQQLPEVSVSLCIDYSLSIVVSGLFLLGIVSCISFDMKYCLHVSVMQGNVGDVC